MNRANTEQSLITEHVLLEKAGSFLFPPVESLLPAIVSMCKCAPFSRHSDPEGSPTSVTS